MAITQELLRQYNKRPKPIDTEADNVNSLVMTSYANPYDALYQQFKDDKNFNLDTLQQAFKLGDQDQYLAFLEKNSTTEMSDQFYDPLYYDYETQMLELYKNIADDTEETFKPRETQEFDYRQNKWVSKDLGKMTDKAWFEYQLTEAYNFKSEKLKYEAEKLEKERTNNWTRLGPTLLGVAGELGEGVLSGYLGVVDALSAPVSSAILAMTNGGTWEEHYDEYYKQYSALGREKESIRRDLEEYERKYTWLKDIDGSITTLGKFLGNSANSIGMMVPAMIMTWATAGLGTAGGISGYATQFAGTSTFYMSIYSNNMYENATNPLTKDSPVWLKITNAATKAVVEATIEYLLGRFLGGTLQNRMIGLEGKSMVETFKGLGKGAGVAYLAQNALQEGLEEFLQDFSTNLIDIAYGELPGGSGYEDTDVTMQTLVDSFLVGAFTSLLMSGGAILRNASTNVYSNIQHDRGVNFAKKSAEAKKAGNIELAKEYQAKAEAAAKRHLATEAPHIEIDGELKPVKGAKRLLWSDFLSDYYSGWEKVKNGKGDMKLAQEIHTIAMTMTDFYSSFDKTRIENCEKLLQKVVAAEQSNKTDEIKVAVKSGTIGKEMGKKLIKAENRYEKTLYAQYAKRLGEQVTEMIGGASSRYATRITKKLEDNAEKVYAAAARNITGVADVDGNVYTVDPAVQAVEKRLKESLLLKSKEFEFIFTTDGRIAVEVDGDLYIPVAWLENYTDSEIYQFLEQEKVLENIMLDDEFAPMMEKIIEHNRAFTKQDNNYERALMDFLFNKSVYQHFLLSQNGANLFAFKDFIFRMHEVINTMITDKGITPVRKEMLNKIYEQIKEAHREPTMKAIVNWNMDPQLIGADSILSEADRRAIRQWQTFKQEGANLIRGSKVAGDYSRHAEDLLNRGHFIESEEKFIREGLKEGADEKQRLQAIAMLNYADGFMGVDFITLTNNLSDLTEYRNNLLDLDEDGLQLIRDHRIPGIDELLTDVEGNQTEIKRLLDERIDEYQAQVKTQMSTGTFSIPAGAFNRTNSIAETAFVADVLNAFKNKYGISAETLFTGRTLGMNLSTLSKLRQEMDVLGVDSYRAFVQKKLEAELGGDYVVTPLKDGTMGIATKIEAKELLGTSDIDIRAMFVKNEQNGTYEATSVGKLFPKTPKELHDYIVELRTDLRQDEGSSLEIFSEPQNGFKGIMTLNAYSKNINQSFVHETNHIIQYETGLPQGYDNEKIAKNAPLVNHALENYPEYLSFVLRMNGNLDAALLLEDGNRAGALALAPNAIFHGVYGLIQGELWARHYMHNGKLAKGYTRETVAATAYIVAPDGQMFLETSSLMGWEQPLKFVKEQHKPSKTEVTNKAQDTFKKAFGIVRDPDAETRDTVHVKLTRKSASELNTEILNPKLPVTTRVRATIDEIIKNPSQYLSQKMMDEMRKQGRTLDEGSVYHFLKDWFETNVEGVSIDRDGVTHEYIFVDDTAFDDMLSRKITDKIDTDGNELVKDSTLDEIYRAKDLTELGIPTDLEVIANPDVNTQAVFNEKHPKGAIYIKTHEGMTNKEFIRKVNHEFRHIVQRYHRFEQGFTADFKVTKKLLADVKKHVPEIYKDQELIDLAKSIGADPDTFITQQFVYFMTGGEQGAYGIMSRILNEKPVFSDIKGGKATVYLPWYDAKTGEGRHNVDFLAQRTMDVPGNPAIPVVKKAPVPRETVTRAESADNNLKYYVEKGKQRQLPSDFKAFVKETTGNEDKLPKEIVFAIQKGKLTKSTLFHWFRDVDASKVNQYTFDLLNKHFFKNDLFENMQDLEETLKGGTQSGVEPIRFWWAASILFKKEGLSDETFAKTNSAQKFLDFMNGLRGSEWQAKINEILPLFDFYLMQKTVKDGVKTVQVNIPMEEKSANAVRVLAMQYFDGSLSGAFYTANALRTIVRKYQNLETEARETSLDAVSETVGDKTDIASTSEAYDPETGEWKESTPSQNATQEIERLGYDISALYSDIETKSQTDMLSELSIWYMEKLRAEGITDIKELTEKSLAFLQELQELDFDELDARYKEAYFEIATGAPADPNTADLSTSFKPMRASIAANIKGLGTRLNNAAFQGKVVWANLPKEIRDMFELTEVTIKGKKYKRYELKPEVYSVGRGAVEGTRAFEAKSHDTKQIIENRDKLRKVLTDVKNNVFANKETSKTVERLERRLEAKTRQSMKQTGKTKQQGDVKETEFRVSKKKRTSDTPNNFTIVSKIDMPAILRKIFDVSFEDMADTKVQFASRDEDGNLYDKNNKEFDGRLKHEVSNWDAFYEANRETLAGLTRTDVLDIVEFIQYGVATLDGPANKLAAFQVFILGYIVDGSKRGFGNWNFSDAEIEVVEKLYEKKASEHGSGLNAVGQMLKVIDPFKKIEQRMLDMYNITEAEQKPLIDAVEKLKTAKTIDERKTIGAEIAAELAKIEDLMYERELDRKTGKTVERGFGKRWYQKLKSWRYMAMLSRPTTWVRNINSNIIITGLNQSADFVGNLVFTGKRKALIPGQWDLARVKISMEAKAFIDNNIKNSELFTFLYDGTTKYADRQKIVKDQKELFVTMIVNSLERKYAADHRFDSNTLNNMAKFVDKMISDKAFIKLAATRYLGKILTIEKVDLTQGLNNTILNFFAEAVIMANEDYMHKRSFAANMVDGLKDKNQLAYEVITFFQPFMNSSFNWFAESLKYTPAGLIKAIYDSATIEKKVAKIQERIENNKRQNIKEVIRDTRVTEYLVRRDIGKGIIGTILIGFGMLLALSGRIRLEDDEDKFYMTVGDMRVDITSLFGSSSVLIGASLAQIGGKSFGDIMTDVAENMAEGFIIKEFIDRHRYDKSFWEVMLTETENAFKSFIPQMVQLFVIATNNQKIRYSPGMKGVWERWLNSWVPLQPAGNRRINPYTGEIETKQSLPIPMVGNLLASGILGPKIFWSEMSETELFAREAGVNKNELTGKLTVDGTEHQLDREQLNKKYGELNKESLAQVSSQKHYVQMPDGSYQTLSWSKLSEAQKKRVIDRTMTNNGEIAKIYVWTEVEGKKYYASDAQWTELRKLGITKNVFRGDKGFA